MLSAAQWLIILTLLDTHPRPAPPNLITDITREWQAQRDREQPRNEAGEEADQWPG